MVKKRKRTAEVPNGFDDEPLCVNGVVENDDDSQIKTEKMKIGDDSLSTEVHDEYMHCVKRTRETIRRNSSVKLIDDEEIFQIYAKKRRVSFAPLDQVNENGEPTFFNPKTKRKQKDSTTQDVAETNHIQTEEKDEDDSAQFKAPLEPFSAQSFRKSLKQEHSLKLLKSFANLLSKQVEGDTEDLLMEYVQAGGSAMEILQQLEIKEDDQSGVANAVFKVLHALIMRSLTDLPDLRPSCLDACQYLLNAYSYTVQRMIEKASSQDVKVTLKLLTGVVTIDTVFAKDVLANIKFPPPLLKIMTTPVRLGEKTNIRTCFIHFLMAFLIDKPVTLIKSFLAKRDLLVSILPGMLFDKAETVHLVLSTIRTYVVENRNIAKNVKRFVFNTDTIKMLLKLYSWHGPRRSAKKMWEAEFEGDSEDRAIVIDALQQLMLILCTCHKLGVVFKDPSIGTFSSGVNELMYNVLKEINRPWDNEYTRDLVVKILFASPDLIRKHLSTMMPYLDPRASPSWLSTISFLKQIVETMDPEVCLRPNVRVLPRDQLPSIVQLFCAPTVLMPIIKEKMLLHANIIVRQTVLELLVVMFKQMQKFFDALEEWGVVDTSEREVFRQKVCRHLPRFELLLEVWNTPPQAPTSGDDALLVVTLSTHLSTLLDVMLLLNITCLSRTPGVEGDVMPSLEMDEPLKLDLWAFLDVIDQVKDDTIKARMQVKAVHVVFECNHGLFRRNQKVFLHSTQVLLQCLHNPDSIASQSARLVLVSILQSTGVFDGFPIEVHIWIHCYYQLTLGMREVAGNLMTKVLVKIMMKPEKYRQEVEITAKQKGAKKGKRPKKNLAQDSNSLVTHPSPLLSGILKHVHKKQYIIHRNDVKDFLNNVVICMSHSLTSSKSMFQLANDKFVYVRVKKYIHWSYQNLEDIPSALKLLFGESSLDYRLSIFILGLESEFTSAIEVLESEKVLANKTSEVETSNSANDIVMHQIEDIDAVHLMLLFDLTLFQVTQLVSQGKLTGLSVSRCEDAFKTLLQSLRLHSGISSQKSPSFDLHCLRKFFSNPILLNSFVSIANTNSKKGRKLPSELILSLILWTASTYSDDIRRQVLNMYKEKLVNALIYALSKKPAKVKKDDKTFENIPAMIGIFEMDYKDVVILLRELTSTPISYLRLMVDDSPGHLSTWGELLTYLIEHTLTLRERDRRKCGALPPSLVTSLANTYVKLRKSETLDLSSLEKSLIKYLEQFPHSQASVPPDVLIATLNTKPECETATWLGMLLLSRNKKLGAVFSNAVIQSSEAGKLTENSSLLFSYCQTLIDNGSASSDRVLQIIYEHYREDIIKGIKKPHKAKPWMTVISMIEKCMAEETCALLCDYIEKYVFKLVSHGFQEFHITLMESVFTKARLNPDDNDKQLVRLIKLILELFTHAAKTEINKLDFLCNSLRKCVSRVGEAQNMSEIKTSPVWFPFMTQVLKLGLQLSKNSECDQVLLLETLSSLCQVMYKDLSHDKEVTTLFEMTLSHSEFLDVMLRSTPTKLPLVRLLSTLVAKSPDVMSSKHVPILLGAYGATLSLTDQLILKLINTYEANNVSMYECRPFLWGEAAMNYYCVKSKETVSLWRQPQTSQVLELLVMETVQTTITKFPLDRKTDLEECADQPYVYDPAFFLPLFSYLLSPEEVVQPYKFTHSGGIALTLASLASHSFEIRALAYHVLSRYHYHLDAGRGRDKEWWLQFLNSIKHGVVALGEESPQLACIVTTFLARASLVISQPLNLMFVPLNRFILAKPAMNLNTIPELYILFNSTRLDSKTHRHFLLEVLRDGLRLSFDQMLAMKCSLFQLLLSYYSSIISDHDGRSKVLILQVLNSAMQISNFAKFFIGGYGFFSWFHEAVRKLKSTDHDLIIPSIKIINSLWQSVVVSKVKTHAVAINKALVKMNVSLLLIEILSKLPPKMTLEELVKFLLLLQSVSAETKTLMTKRHLSTLVEFCKALLGSLDECEDMLEFGCRFIKKNCDKVNALNQVDEAKSILRGIIVLWWVSQQKKNEERKFEGKNPLKERIGINKVRRKATLNVKTAKEKSNCGSKKSAVLSKKKKKGANSVSRETGLTEERPEMTLNPTQEEA